MPLYEQWAVSQTSRQQDLSDKWCEVNKEYNKVTQAQRKKRCAAKKVSVMVTLLMLMHEWFKLLYYRALHSRHRCVKSSSAN